MRPTLEWESRLGYPGALVAGVDEVGRGCLAGPVVAGAVLLPPVVDEAVHPWLSQVADSKLLRQNVREELAPLIQGWALSWAIGVASVEEIDRINILQASHLAMRRAIEALQVPPAKVLIDGKFTPLGLSCEVTAVVQGDRMCLSVAAASVIAKVWRDRHMVELDTRYPGYGFGVHKGYGTPAHKAALQKQGVCEIHRRSFAPVAEVLSRL